MPDNVIQVAPDSTGKMLRTRSRVVGANTVHEQYVISSLSNAVPVNRVWATSLRIPSRTLVAAATQPVFSIWNGITAGGNLLSIRRFSVEVDAIGAYTTAGPLLRLYRTTAAATGGSTITPVQQDTADTALNASVVVRADHQGDNVSATTALAQTGLGASPLWAQTVPRVLSATGWLAPTELNLLPNDPNLNAVDPLILRPSEGCHVQFINGATATSATVVFTLTFKAVLAEFTYA